MKIHIESSGENVMTLKDFSDLQDRGEVSHFIAEIELIKLELLELWSELSQESAEVSEEKAEDQEDEE